MLCPTCGETNAERARFCQACATPLQGDPSAEERRIVSVLFVDVVGFTSRSEQQDPEDVRSMLSHYYERARAEIERYGGTVEKFIGDAVMAVFGAPVAYGDDPERAVRAALAVRDAIRDMDEADPMLDLRVRVAVNTGEAIVELRGGERSGVAMVAGDVVNTAARLQSAAPVNGVLVGAETFACTRTVIDYEKVEAVVAKGKSEPVPAWLAVAPLVPVGERTFSQVHIVGRGRELSTLRGEWDGVCEGRRPHLLTVFGPTGIGKSRVCHELFDRVDASDGLALHGRSVGYGDTGPYSAFAQQVARVAGIFDTDGADTSREKLRACTREFVPDDPEAIAVHIAILSGIPVDGAVSDRDTLFFSARLFMEAVARRRPTLLLFEDIHWSDDSLLDLIEFLASRVQDVPLMLLATARPELLTERPSWGGGLPAYSSVSLGPLSEQDSEELTKALFEQRGLGELADRAASLAGSSDGNPLFMEEIAASLAERSTRDASQMPTSIRGIVAARLDALPPAEREVVMDASVVGKSFWRGALERLRPERHDLPELLGALERRDLVRREASSRIEGEQEFAFKHALIREVAYLTLPRAERRQRHATHAQYLEDVTLAAGDADATLAYHWREAGYPDRALEHVLAAADYAGRGWAKQRAVHLYSQALELLPANDGERRREIVRRRAVAAASVMHTVDVEHARGLRAGDPAPPSRESLPE